MPLADLADFLDRGLQLPYRGKRYLVPSPDFETGLRLQALYSVGRSAAAGVKVTAEQTENLKLDDEQESSFYRDALGPVYDELRADSVPFVALKGLAYYAWGYWVDGPATARQLMEYAVSGEVAAPEKPSTRQPAAASKSKASRGSTGSATTTRPPASMSGWNSPETAEPAVEHQPA